MRKKKLIQQILDSSRLILDATEGIADIVKNMQQRIGSGPKILGEPFAELTQLMIAPSHLTLRLVTHVVRKGIDTVAPPFHVALPQEGLERGIFLSALNGVIGDYLATAQSSLAIDMQLCYQGQTLAIDRDSIQERCPPSQRLLILIHGSCLDEQSWQRKAWDYGQSLAEDCAYLPLYVRYNSGLHISENGALLMQMLGELSQQWPWPIESITLLGHSMGGLVAFSAMLQADQTSQSWRAAVKRLISLGSPYHGSPLERGGHWLDTLLSVHSYTEPLTKLGKIRSCGVTDLRFGSILQEDWQDHDRFARHTDPRRTLQVPKGLRVCTVAASLSAPNKTHPASDGLVPVASALGQHQKPELCLKLPESDQLVVRECHHMDLLSRPEVYQALKIWCSDALS